MAASALNMKATTQQTLMSNAFAMNGDSSAAEGTQDRHLWHALSAGEVIRHLRTCPEGLSNENAAERRDWNDARRK